MIKRILAAVILGMLTFPFHSQAEEAAPQKSTYALVHGAWGGGWTFRQVEKILTADGSKVYRPTLTGLGDRNHLARDFDVDLDTHIKDIVNLILWEDLHDVVLVGHSYGGMVITGVVDRIPDRIKRVVYYDALLPNDGDSAADLSHMDMNGPNITDGFIIPWWVKPGDPLPHDVPHPIKTFTQPISLKNQDKAIQVPTTYVLTVDEGKQPKDDLFFPYYERAKARGWETFIMTGDHNVQWSHPEELSAYIRDSKGQHKQ